jgi:hypothetical protein
MGFRLPQMERWGRLIIIIHLEDDEESLMLTAKKWQLERDASELALFARIQLQIEQVQKAKGKHQQELLALTIE